MPDNLTERILAFCIHLRELGFLIGPREIRDSLEALRTIDIGDRAQFQACLRLVTCSDVEEIPVFDHAFKEFFFKIRHSESGKQDLLHYLTQESNAKHRKEQRPTEEPQKGVNKQQKKNRKSGQPMEAGLGDRDTKGESTLHTYLWTADKAAGGLDGERQITVNAAELERMDRAAAILAKNTALKRSRVYRSSRSGTKPDMRKMMRKSLQTGGLPIQMNWKNRQKRRGRFILLCDASRSMSLYAQRYVQFAYALGHHSGHVEVFLFSTGLKRVTEQLFEQQQSLPVLRSLGDSWGGGTCIGESIASFVHEYGRKLLNRETVVLIASDGLDAGDVSRMGWAMNEIQKRADTIIWLNPLLNIPGYQPVARGMSAALPYIDLFSGASDSASLIRMAKKANIGR